MRLLTKIVKGCFALTGWAGSGAICTALVAALDGMIYGALEGLANNQPWRFVSVGLYFALCGGVAGALAGAFIRAADPEGIADLIGHRAHAATPKPGEISALPRARRWLKDIAHLSRTFRSRSRPI